MRSQSTYRDLPNVGDGESYSHAEYVQADEVVQRREEVGGGACARDTLEGERRSTQGPITSDVSYQFCHDDL